MESGGTVTDREHDAENQLPQGNGDKLLSQPVELVATAAGVRGRRQSRLERLAATQRRQRTCCDAQPASRKLPSEVLIGRAIPNLPKPLVEDIPELQTWNHQRLAVESTRDIRPSDQPHVGAG